MSWIGQKATAERSPWVLGRLKDGAIIILHDRIALECQGSPARLWQGIWMGLRKGLYLPEAINSKKACFEKAVPAALASAAGAPAVRHNRHARQQISARPAATAAGMTMHEACSARRTYLELHVNNDRFIALMVKTLQ